jgi:hypothetical protein
MALACFLTYRLVRDMVHSFVSFVGLDHRVGPLVSMTAPDNQRLDIVKGCTKRATSPSLAIYFSHDRGVRKRR